MHKALELSKSVGLNGGFRHEEQLPLHAYCGYETSIEILLYSRRPEKHSKLYTQCEIV